VSFGTAILKSWRSQNSNREIGNLVNLPDNYQKTVLTANRMDVGEVDGVKVVHVVDWLVGEWYFYYAIET